jgi:hypothetical protein
MKKKHTVHATINKQLNQSKLPVATEREVDKASNRKSNASDSEVSSGLGSKKNHRIQVTRCLTASLLTFRSVIHILHTQARF